MKILLVARPGENDFCTQYALLEFEPTESELFIFDIMYKKPFKISAMCREGGTDYKIGNYLAVKYNPDWISLDEEDQKDMFCDEIEELVKETDTYDMSIWSEYINVEDEEMQKEIFHGYLEFLKRQTSKLSPEEEPLKKKVMALEYEDFFGS